MDLPKPNPANSNATAPQTNAGPGSRPAKPGPQPNTAKAESGCAPGAADGCGTNIDREVAANEALDTAWAPQAVDDRPVAPAGETQPLGGQRSAAKSGKRRKSGGFLGSVQSLAVTVVIAVFVITFVVQAFQIPSESMEDTLLIGDYLLVDKVHFAYGGIWGEMLPYTRIRRGDIIVFRYPVHPQQHFVKRVIGLPGDRIRMVEKQVFVNDEPLREKYVVYRSSGHDSYRDDFPRIDLLNANVEGRWWQQMRSLVHNGELTVPPGQYFVLGDNRDESLDSRYWGFVPRENVIGRPLLIYWSMRHPERLGAVAENPGDKLLYFAYTVTHLFQETRWNRAFRLVK